MILYKFLSNLPFNKYCLNNFNLSPLTSQIKHLTNLFLLATLTPDIRFTHQFTHQFVDLLLKLYEPVGTFNSVICSRISRSETSANPYKLLRTK